MLTTNAPGARSLAPSRRLRATHSSLTRPPWGCAGAVSARRCAARADRRAPAPPRSGAAVRAASRIPRASRHVRGGRRVLPPGLDPPRFDDDRVRERGGHRGNPFPWVYSGTSCFSEGGNVEHSATASGPRLSASPSRSSRARRGRTRRRSAATKSSNSSSSGTRSSASTRTSSTPRRRSPSRCKRTNRRRGFVHPPGPQTGTFPATFPPTLRRAVALVAEVDGANAAAWANEAGASGAGASEAGAARARRGRAAGSEAAGDREDWNPSAACRASVCRPCITIAPYRASSATDAFSSRASRRSGTLVRVLRLQEMEESVDVRRYPRDDAWIFPRSISSSAAVGTHDASVTSASDGEARRARVNG